jgi:hypothetical protein
MSADESKQVCENCKAETKFFRPKINHPFHLVLSLLTGGLWLISYGALLLGHRMQPWTCSNCDHKQHYHPPQNTGNFLVRLARSIRRIFLRQAV